MGFKDPWSVFSERVSLRRYTTTGFGLDLAAVGKAVGFAETGVVTDDAGVEALAAALHARATGPRLYVVRVRAENVARSLPPRDAVWGKNRLRAHLGFGVS